MNAVSSRTLARVSAAKKVKVKRLVEALDVLPAPREIQPREPIEFPDRAGLI